MCKRWRHRDPRDEGVPSGDGGGLADALRWALALAVDAGDFESAGAVLAILKALGWSPQPGTGGVDCPHERREEEREEEEREEGCQASEGGEASTKAERGEGESRDREARGGKKVVAKKRAAKKLVVKKAASAKAKPAAKPAKAPTVKRRDAIGHLDPKYAAELRALGGHPKDDDRAFPNDALSEELGEEFVETVTSGEDEGTEIRDRRVTEEIGGPFTVTTGGTEFASGVDPSNPKQSKREPFPRT